MLLSLFLHLDTFLNMGRGLMMEEFWSQLPRGSTSRGLEEEEEGEEAEAGVASMAVEVEALCWL